MRILHIIDSLSGGGRERRLVQLTKGLRQEKEIEKQYILILNPIVDYSDVYASNVEIIVVQSRKSKLSYAVSLYKQIKSIKPDIVHVWTSVPLILLSITSLSKPFLGYKLIAGFVADGNRIGNLSTKIGINLSYIFANAVVSNSKAGLVAKHAPMKKSHVIYNGFDYARLKNITETDVLRLRKELNINSKYIVTMMARFTSAKDYQTFLDTALLIQAKRDDVTFLAVGKGEQFEFYKEKSKAMGLHNVVFAGFRKDIDTILAATHICLLFSNEEVHAEGVSNSIMESMASGVPVIASDGGGTPEIITDSEDGFMVSPKDSEGAHKRICQLLNDNMLHERMSKAAINTIHCRFLLDDMTKKYMELYNSLLHK